MLMHILMIFNNFYSNRIMNHEEIQPLLSGKCNLVQQTQAKCKNGGPGCRDKPPDDLNVPVLNLQIPVQDERNKGKCEMQHLIIKYLCNKEATYPCDGCETQEATFIEKKKIMNWPKHLFINASRRHPFNIEEKVSTYVMNTDTIFCEGNTYILKSAIIHKGRDCT